MFRRPVECDRSECLHAATHIVRTSRTLGRYCASHAVMVAKRAEEHRHFPVHTYEIK